MHVQSCCFANQAYCFFAVLVAVAVVVAKAPYCNYYINQSELLSRLRTDFMSSVWNFCNGGSDVPLGELSLAERRQERQLFLQAMSSCLGQVEFLLAE